MKRALILFLLVAILAGLIAWVTAYRQHQSRLATAEAAVINEVDMQRVALHLADLARQSERASVILFTAAGNREAGTTDPDWFGRLSSLLRESAFDSLPAATLGLPVAAIELYTADHLLARLNIYGSALGVTGPALSGLYNVRAETTSHLQDLMHAVHPPRSVTLP